MRLSDLDPQKKNINKIKSYKCDNCKIIQNNPWFSEEISKKFIMRCMVNTIKL